MLHDHIYMWQTQYNSIYNWNGKNKYWAIHLNALNFSSYFVWTNFTDTLVLNKLTTFQGL